MDRASDSGSEGWGFESLPVYQKDQIPFGIWSFCYPERKELEQSNARLRWSLACRRLDGGNTFIFTEGENVNESLPVYQKAFAAGEAI